MKIEPDFRIIFIRVSINMPGHGLILLIVGLGGASLLCVTFSAAHWLLNKSNIGFRMSALYRKR